MRYFISPLDFKLELSNGRLNYEFVVVPYFIIFKRANEEGITTFYSIIDFSL